MSRSILISFLHRVGLVAALIGAGSCAPHAAQPPLSPASPPNALVVETPESLDRSAAYPPGECARLLSASADATNIAHAGDLRAWTPEHEIEVAMHEIERNAAALERLRDGLSSAVLADEANALMQAAAYLKLEVAHLLALEHAGSPDLGPYERALYVAGRQLDLTVHAARARCEADPSREQSAIYQQQSIAVVHALMEPLQACITDEKKRTPDLVGHLLSIKIHIDADGRVTLAGPIGFGPFSGFTAELPYCVMRVLEQARFPPPNGTAIMVVPFGGEK